MLDFVKKYLTKREGKIKYNNLLKDFLSDGKLDEKEKKELERLSKEYNITELELIEAHKKGSTLAFQNIISDGKITDEEKEALEDLMKYFKVSQKDFKFDQKSFNKFYTLGLIDKGILPEIQQHDIDIIFKKGEILHWGCTGALRKYQRVTNRINYSGPIASIKIMKGVRYRMGSIGYSTSSSEYLINEDTGVFWLTNQRIGFRGNRKNFVFPYTKIHAFELTKDGLTILKDGREKPYIVGLDDYDIPCMIISHILNDDKE